MKLPKIEFNSPVIISYTVLAFIVLMFGYATGGASDTAVFSCYRTSLTDPMMYVRAITYVLGHSDINHYVNNFFMIALIGPMLEEKYGSKRLLEMMFVTALVGGLANILLTKSALMGASGIVFLFIVLCSCTSVSNGKIPLTLVIVVVIYIGQEILNGVLKSDNVSQLTHILGGVCGIIFGVYYLWHPIKK